MGPRIWDAFFGFLPTHGGAAGWVPPKSTPLEANEGRRKFTRQGIRENATHIRGPVAQRFRIGWIPAFAGMTGWQREWQ
jgi:hypothetical protein